MRVLGLDPSTSKTGWAIVQDGDPVKIGLWKPKAKIKKQGDKLQFIGEQLKAVLPFIAPDLIVIEECGRPPRGNVDIMRKLVRAEAICGYEAWQLGYEPMLVAVTAVRKELTGKGNATKELVYNTLRECYPGLPWMEFDKGGNDQSDALAMALAGPALADRK